MPLSADNVIQENSGATTGADSTTVAVTLPSGTTAGSTLIAGVTGGGIASSFTPPAGWTKDVDTGSTNSPATLVYRKPPDLVTGGETSWTFTNASATKWAWYVAEVTGLDPADQLDAFVATFSQTSTGTSPVTRSTGTSSAGPSLDTVAFAFFESNVVGATNAPGTWAGYTNGFAEVAEVAAVSGGTASRLALAAARSFSGGAVSGPFETTATYTPVSSTDHAYGLMVVYRGAGSPTVNPIAWQLGFEHGTHNGLLWQTLMGTQLQGSAVGTVGTDFIVQASSARGSAYGCRIVQAGAAKYLTSTGISATAKGLTSGFDMRVVSGSGTPIVGEWSPSAGTVLHLVYDVTNTQYGLRWGAGGTVSWQGGTTALNSFVWIDVRVTGVTTATWHADWRLETGAGTYTDQTSPADLTGQTPATSMTAVRVGGNAAQTVTLDVDNIIASAYASPYPMGPHVLSALRVDPAGTPTVNGTVGNFALVTSNATGAALTTGTLTTARDNIDDLPPTVSASADGVVQTTAAATDYLQFPMETVTLGPAEILAGVRLLACLISTTGAGAGNLGIRGYDGTTEASLVALVGVTPGSSTTVGNLVPPWTTAMWNPVNGWTQAKIDAAALRIGFSGDATPDMGVHAVYLEVAVGQTRTRQLFGDFATVEEDPNRLGVMSVTVAAPSGGDSTLYYEDNTVPSTVPVATETTVTQQIDSETSADANYIAFYPPPEGVPDA